MSRDKRGNRTQEVDGSSPFSSTNRKQKSGFRSLFSPQTSTSFPDGSLWNRVVPPVLNEPAVPKLSSRNWT